MELSLVTALIIVGIAFGADCPGQQVFEAGSKKACGLFEEVEVDYRDTWDWGKLFIECMRMCGKLQPNCTLFYTPSLTAFEEEGWKCMVSLPESQKCDCNTNRTRMARVGKGGFTKTCEELTTASQTTEPTTPNCPGETVRVSDLGSGCYLIDATTTANWNNANSACVDGTLMKITSTEQMTYLATQHPGGVWVGGKLSDQGVPEWTEDPSAISSSFWPTGGHFTNAMGSCIMVVSPGILNLRNCDDVSPYACEV